MVLLMYSNPCMKMYVCTLSNECMTNIKCSESNAPASSILPVDSGRLQLTTASQITISDKTKAFIESTLSKSSGDIITVSDTEDEGMRNDCWLEINRFYLPKSDKEEPIANDIWLNDNHILCAQMLLHNQFRGLQPTILQKTNSLTLRITKEFSTNITHRL